jgi:hypothetical protein
MSESILATIGYVAPMIVPPVSAPVPSRNKMKYDRREMPVYDGHAIPGGARLDTHGFACLRHEMSPVDFDDGSEWRERFTQEATEFVRRMTGASDVVTRSVAPRSTRYSDSAGTIDFCHNDYTGASIGSFIAEIDPDRAEERLSKRFAVYNLWRLLSPPPQNRPLAVCDATTVAGADVVPSQTYTHGENYYQNALFRYNPRTAGIIIPRCAPTRCWSGRPMIPTPAFHRSCRMSRSRTPAVPIPRPTAAISTPGSSSSSTPEGWQG